FFFYPKIAFCFLRPFDFAQGKKLSAFWIVLRNYGNHFKDRFSFHSQTAPLYKAFPKADAKVNNVFISANISCKLFFENGLIL
ncbi:MAG: hypothetical protein LBO74_12070, partial [Candidatus Symbiothrix sp.]|nr:hypothetical protein [Candidatus Symbiothrix sp.]